MPPPSTNVNKGLKVNGGTTHGKHWGLWYGLLTRPASTHHHVLVIIPGVLHHRTAAFFLHWHSYWWLLEHDNSIKEWKHTWIVAHSLKLCFGCVMLLSRTGVAEVMPDRLSASWLPEFSGWSWSTMRAADWSWSTMRAADWSRSTISLSSLLKLYRWY